MTNMPDFSLPENLSLQKGRLLVAAPFLLDPRFSRTVILLCEHNDEGSFGLVLNNRTDTCLEEIIPEAYGNKRPIYQGGPVQTDTMHLLHNYPAILGGNKIIDGLYWGGVFEIAYQQKTSEKDIKLFMGYAGWGEGQLEAEVAIGSWIVTEATPSFVLDTDGSTLWRRVVATLGSQYAYLANAPVNPQLN